LPDPFDLGLTVEAGPHPFLKLAEAVI